MKTRKKVFVAGAAATAILAIGLVVACSNDDAGNSLNPTSSQVSLKSSEAIPQSQDAFLIFWEAINNAYRKDSSALHFVCMNNDYEAFFSLTGITSEMRASALIQIEEMMQDCLAAHPEWQSQSYEGCHCSTSSLLTLYDVMVDINKAYDGQGINVFEIMKSNPVINPELFACLQDCLMQYYNHHCQDSLYLCQEICYLVDHFKDVTPEDPGLVNPLEP